VRIDDLFAMRTLKGLGIAHIFLERQ